MFSLLRETGKNICYQCGEEIELIDQLSIEHKIPYLDSDDPKKLFFDLNNIGFSHLNCNIKASRQDIESLRLQQQDKCKKGEHSLSNLNEDKVLEIREYLKTHKQHEAVKEFNISKFAISRIATKKSFSYL